MTLFESIPTEIDHALSGERVWADEAIRAAADEVIDLAGHGLLAVKYRGEHSVSFAVFEMAHGPVTDTKTGAIVGGTKWHIVFHGDGTGDRGGGGLREFRHSYWGDEGYMFYADGKLIADALRTLERWFDL